MSTDDHEPLITTTTVKATAADRKVGMTVAELQAFTAATTQTDLPAATRVKVRVGTRGQIQRIETT